MRGIHLGTRPTTTTGGAAGRVSFYIIDDVLYLVDPVSGYTWEAPVAFVGPTTLPSGLITASEDTLLFHYSGGTWSSPATQVEGTAPVGGTILNDTFYVTIASVTYAMPVTATEGIPGMPPGGDTSLVTIDGKDYLRIVFPDGEVRYEEVHSVPTPDASGGGGSTASDLPYDASAWDGNLDAATKNVLRDKFESLDSGAINLKSYGAVGNGVADDSVIIQTAIDTGRNIDLVGASYAVSGLTQSLDNQSIVSTGGIGTLIKNANGPILTSTGNFVQCQNIKFHGEGFTGDNVTFSGQSCALLNCGSQFAAGRAVKATGGHFQITGTCGIYHTSDTTATGYEIEIGISGTNTLYHQLEGIYSSVATGGILFVDTGSHCISGGQFGKLTIQTGAAPAGANGGITKGARILGNVFVGSSNANFTGNQFSVVSITFAATTSGCTLDATNQLASGATVTNLGNANNYIQRNNSSGSLQEIRYGQDGENAVVKVHLPQGDFYYPCLISPLIVGGVDTSSDLTFKTTKGVGTAGADMHFAVGADGATEALTILNSGNVGVGNVSPTTAKFDVQEFGAQYALRIAKAGSSNDAAFISNSGTSKITLNLVAGGSSGASALFAELQNATAIGLRVKGWTAHSGNLLEFRDISDALLSFVGPSGALSVPDDPYNPSSWDDNLSVPTKNAVRDKIESLAAGASIVTGYKTTNQLTASGTAVNATSLSFAIAAGEVWSFEFYLGILNEAAGSSPKFAFDIPAACTIGALVSSTSTSASFAQILADSTLTSGVLSTTTGRVIITGLVQNGANAGTIQLMFASGDGINDTSIVGGQSYFVARKMN